MPKQLSPDQIAAIDSSTGYAAYLLELVIGPEVAPTHINLTTAPINVEYNGKTYVAKGNFLSFGSISESVSINTSEINVSLSGVPHSVIELFRDSAGDIVNRPLTIYRAVVDKKWGTTTDPIFIFKGQCVSANAVMGYQNNRGSAVINVRVANKFTFFGRSKLSRTNVAEHQIKYLGDKGFEYVAYLSTKDLKWSP